MKINGNLVFNSDASGELQNVYIERKATNPAFNAAEKGRVVFNTTSSVYYYNDGSAWVAFATGGNAAALQSEVDAIETSLGSAVNANGSYNGASAFTGTVISTASSITDALLQLASYAGGHDQLSELGDVLIGSLVDGQYLKYDATSGKWKNETFVLADVTDVTATAAEVNILHGATVTTTELNYVHGVTSSIQNQLDNKQPLDATLTALSAMSGTGIIVETGVDTFDHRSLVQPAAGITITDADGVAGNPTFSLANDLAGIEGLATTGFAVRTGDGTWTTRHVEGTAGNIDVTNHDGIAGNAVVDLAAVVDNGTGSFLKLSTDGFGRVVGTTAVVTSDITALVDTTYVNVAGDTMTGNLNMDGHLITNLGAPVSGSDAVTKNYVDAKVAGLSWKQAVHAMAASNIDIASAPASVDGHTLNNGERVLLIAQSTGSENGIYVFNGAGNALTRAEDADTYAEIDDGTAVFVEAGLMYANTGWTQTALLSSFSGQDWHQFSGAGTYSAGTGLDLTGNTFSVKLGAGIGNLPSGQVGIDLYSSTAALRLTLDGSTATTDHDAMLTLVLKSAGGLTQDVNGLYIPAAGVTNAMLAHDHFSLGANSGAVGDIALGGSLNISGDSGAGVSTYRIADDTMGITVADASYSQKGVAVFDTLDFSVTAGAVSIKAGGVDNNQLAFSTITVAGSDASSDDVALGETLTFIDGGAHNSAGSLVKTSVAANGVTVAVREATASLKGVASFDAADFNVSAGAVTLVGKNLDSLTDVTVTSAGAGDTLVYSAGSSQFVNRKTYFLYSGASATSHAVVHNLNQKYCNVTVVDADDEVVIPQSITFDSASQLTVTFTSAVACKIVVMGVDAS